MVKDVDVAVFETIRSVQEGRFQSGIHEFGLREDGVRIVRDEHNRDLLPDDVFARLVALRDSVAQGLLAVPKE